MIYNNLTKSICVVFFLMLFAACEIDNLQPEKETEPATFEYGNAILEMSLPDNLLLKSDTNEHAKFVLDQWAEMQNRIVEWNESIDTILYEIELSTVLDASNSMGSDWLPIKASSKEVDGYRWNDPHYQAQFYQSLTPSRGIVEVGLDKENHYIIWYERDNYCCSGQKFVVTELKQSLDGSMGSITLRWLVDAEYSDRHITEWEINNSKLKYSFLRSDLGVSNRRTGSFKFELSSMGNGVLTFLDSCSDRYFWTEAGDGVYEKREFGFFGQSCQTPEITRW